jgi:hypothetical protein
MNRTTQKACRAKWGDDTANWVGKKVRVRKVRQPVRGELKDVLFGEPIETILTQPENNSV